MGALAQRNTLEIKASLIAAMALPLHTSVLETRPLATAATAAVVPRSVLEIRHLPTTATGAAATRRESEISSSLIAAMEHQATVKESAIRPSAIDFFTAPLTESPCNPPLCPDERLKCLAVVVPETTGYATHRKYSPWRKQSKENRGSQAKSGVQTGVQIHL